MQYFNMQPRDAVSTIQRQTSASTLGQASSEFRYDSHITLEENLNEFFRMKKQQQEVELLARQRMDMIRSVSNPNLWI